MSGGRWKNCKKKIRRKLRKLFKIIPAVNLGQIRFTFGIFGFTIFTRLIFDFNNDVIWRIFHNNSKLVKKNGKKVRKNLWNDIYLEGNKQKILGFVTFVPSPYLYLFKKTCHMAACNLSAYISQDLCSCNDFPNFSN